MGIEAAENRGRKLREVDHRVEQRFVFTPARAGDGARRRVERFANLMFAFSAPQNFRRSQRINVSRSSPRNRDCTIGQDAMSTRLLPCLNAIELERNRLSIEHRDQPPHRTHEALGRLAPVHILRPVDGGEFLRQKLGKNLRRAATLLRDLGREVFALRSSNSFQVGNVDASLLGEGVGRRSGLAIFVCDVDGRSSNLLDHVGLRGGNAGGQDCKAPRSVEVSDLASRQSLAAQQRYNTLAQFVRGGVNHPRRNFFASDL